MSNIVVSKCCGAKMGIVKDAPAISSIKIGDEVCVKCFAPFVEAEERIITEQKISRDDTTLANRDYLNSVVIPDKMRSPIKRPVYYNKFSGYICDRNDVPVVEVVGENDKVGQFISEAINNFK